MNKLEIGFESKDEEQAWRRKKANKIKGKYWLTLVAMIVVLGGYIPMFNLQSSIHVLDGVGTRITTLTYVTLVVVSFFIAPALLRLLGPKKALILSECSLLLYVIANIFSSETVLFLGAFAASFGESIFWIPLGISFVYFAKKYQPYTDKTLDECIVEFSGTMVGTYHLSEILGNSIASLSLNIFENAQLTEPLASSNGSYNSTATVTDSFSVKYDQTKTTATSTTDWLAYCAANDCQDKEIIDETVDQYIPKNTFTMYFVIGCFILLMCIGILCHVMILPEMPFESYNTPSSKCSKSDHPKDQKQSTMEYIKQVLAISFETSKDLILQFFHPHQLLFVTPYSIYVGLNSGFIMVEATRAYASCILGVSQVGVCLSIYAAINTVQCYLIGRVFGRHGRIPLIIFGACFDLALYMTCLLWHPTEESHWFVYLLFAFFGIYNANVEMVTVTLFGSEFYKTKEISFNIWMITFAIGYALQTAFSTLLCVRFKIYLLMAWVVIASSLTGIYEFKMKQKQKLPTQRGSKPSK